MIGVGTCLLVWIKCGEGANRARSKCIYQLMYAPTTAHIIQYKALLHFEFYLKHLEIAANKFSIESKNVIQHSMSRDVRITEIRSWNGMYYIPSSVVSDHRITMIVLYRWSLVSVKWLCGGLCNYRSQNPARRRDPNMILTAERDPISLHSRVYSQYSQANILMSAKCTVTLVTLYKEIRKS